VLEMGHESSSRAYKHEALNSNPSTTKENKINVHSMISRLEILSVANISNIVS
jgi:hypothetical protein